MEIGMSQHDIAYRFKQKGTQDPYSGSWSSCLSRRTRSTLKTENKTILHLITKLVQEELLLNSILITEKAVREQRKANCLAYVQTESCGMANGIEMRFAVS